MFTLTARNYHTPEANQIYMSCSQYSDFLTCEAMAMARINGEWNPPPTIPCQVGSYVHAWNEGALAQFTYDNPDIFTKQGKLKAQFQQAEVMITTLEKDPLCMMFLSGQKEVIYTAEFAGVWWKIMVDSDNTHIVDLKTPKSIRQLEWNPAWKCKTSFIETFNYFRNMAIYLEIDAQANDRDAWREGYIVAVSKEDPPDKAIISLNDPDRIQQELDEVARQIPHIMEVKHGGLKPERCEKCAYCRSTKQLSNAIDYRDLEGGY